jgi:hypothetical protein
MPDSVASTARIVDAQRIRGGAQSASTASLHARRVGSTRQRGSGHPHDDQRARYQTTTRARSNVHVLSPYRLLDDEDELELALELPALGPASQFAVFFGMFHFPVTTPPFFAPLLSCG